MAQGTGMTTTKRKWLTRTVAGVAIASFLSDAGHEAATTALPTALAALGAAPAVLGVIEGVADGLSSFAKLYGGQLANRPHLRKPLAVIGYFVTGLTIALYGLATGWWHVLAARSVGWMARGIRGPARDTLLTEAVPAEVRGRAFGLHRAMDTAGAVVGPLLAMVLVARVTLPAVFWWAAVPGMLAALAFGALVHADGQPVPQRPPPFADSLRAMPAAYRRLLVAVFLFGCGDFARTLLILRAIQLLAPEHGAVAAAATAALLYAGHNVVHALASYPVGHLADSISPRKLLVVGYALGAATALLAAFATPSVPLLALLFAVAGLTLAFEDTLEALLVARLVPAPVRGTGFGVMAATNGVGDLISSAFVGLLWTMSGATTAFLAAAALCAAGTVLLVPRAPEEAALA